MPERRVTRRDALRLGAGAAALATLPAPALGAACEVPVFELGLEDDLAARAASAGGWRTLAPRRAPGRFDLIGLRWRHARGVRAQVRARRRGGDWTRWADLHAHGDHGPDGERPVPGTDPAWTGAADLFQVRLRGDVRGLRARFVHAAPAGRSARASSARRRQPPPPAGAPAIVSRAEWGADRCPPRTDPSFGEVQLAFVHHTVSANDYGPEDSAAIVLGICRYHRDSNGWNDIGYNFLVDRYGQVFEGRAGGIDQAVVGAQAQGYNSVSTGVACIGDFSSLAQSEAGLDALAHLIGWKLSLHGAPTQGTVTVTSAGGSANRHPSGAQVTFERISGHRDGNRTACPGEALYAQLATVRERAAAHGAPTGSLSMRAAPSRVRHGRPVEVSGTLRFADGTAAAGAPIEVWHAAADGETAVLARTTTGPDGSWRAEATPPASGRLRARFPGDGAHAAQESRSVGLEVLPRLTLKVSPRSAEAGTAVSVDGTLGPTWPSRVRLVFQRRSGRRWTRVQRKRINVRGGRFASYVRPAAPGRYRVTVKAPGARRRRGLRVVTFTGGASAG